MSNLIRNLPYTTEFPRVTNFLTGSIAGLAGAVGYNLFDEGFAELLAVETLTQQVNPLKYLKVRFCGENPNPVSKTTESAKQEGIQSKKYTRVFKDGQCASKDFNFANAYERVLFKILYYTPFISIRYRDPDLSFFKSGYDFVAKRFSNEDLNTCCSLINGVAKCVKAFVKVIGGVSFSLACPVLYYRFSQKDQDRYFEKNSDHHPSAYKTSRKIEAWRIGLLGTIVTGVNLDWFSRVGAQPLTKTLLGIAKLVGGLVLIAFTIQFLALNRLSIIVPIIAKTVLT